IGVPLVLLGLRPEHQKAVVEIGTNQRGEVRELSRVAEPDVAVLTLVAHEHSEGLGDLDEIEVEEGDLFRSLSPQAIAVGNVDDPRVRRQLGACPAARRISYGSAEDAEYRLIGRRSEGIGNAEIVIERGGEQLTLSSPLLGDAGAYAVLAALAAGESAL